jgi:hypothetical protein
MTLMRSRQAAVTSAPSSNRVVARGPAATGQQGSISGRLAAANDPKNEKPSSGRMKYVPPFPPSNFIASTRGFPLRVVPPNNSHDSAFVGAWAQAPSFITQLLCHPLFCKAPKMPLSELYLSPVLKCGNAPPGRRSLPQFVDYAQVERITPRSSRFR